MRRLIPICVLWTIIALAAGLAGVWRIHTHPIPGVPAELRAARLGLGIGALTVTGYAVFWLVLALTARKKDPGPPASPRAKTQRLED